MMKYKFFNKKTASGSVKNENISERQFAEELHKFNKRICFLLCVIDIFRENACVVPVKDKKHIAIANAFQKVLDESNRKPSKTWISKGGKFCRRLMKSCLEKNTIEMYLIHNEGKSVVAENFIRTLKNKTYTRLTSILKNVYIDKLDGIVSKYDITYHRTIKMKPVDVKPSIYIDFNRENDIEGPKFKICGNARISKYKNIFAKDYVSN